MPIQSGLSRSLRRLRYGAPVVVVSGLPRSGTSMAMRMLEAGGMQLVTDGTRTADGDNPRGYFELERVMSLEQQSDRSWLRDARGRAVKIISYLLLHLPPDNNYRVLFMDRDLREIIASQNKMLDNRGEPRGDDAELTRRYEEHLEKVRFILRRRAWFTAIEVPHKSVIDDPLAAARRMAEFVGRPLDTEAMAGAVERSLYRNRA